MLESQHTQLLQRAFRTAVGAAQPAQCMPPAIAALSQSPALVLGAGKAAAAMAATFAAHWQAPVRGLVVTRYEHGLTGDENARGIEVIEAGHPSPDSASVAAGQRLLALANTAAAEEQLIWLVSGGGSALAAAPLPPLTFEQKRDAADHLMRSGADIREINCVRKHLSGLKGGRLAATMHPRRVATFAISDVPGDDIAAIASGPTVADPTTQAQAIEVLRKYAYPGLAELEVVLGDPTWETPKPGEGHFAEDSVFMLATAATALQAARDVVAAAGFEVLYLGDDLADEAGALGREHAALALAQKNAGRRVAILSGGETRVVIRASGGRGGRNVEYLAGVASGLAGAAGIHAIAADTDGIDGHGGHAGGILTPETPARAARAGQDADAALGCNDCYRYFEAADGLLITGPTRTNVNDFRLILVEP